MPKGGGCPEKQCPQGYKSAADKTHTAGGYGFHSKRPCLRRPNTRIPAATEARTNTACTLRRRRSVVPIPSVFADNPLSRPHAICRGWWRQVNSHISKSEPPPPTLMSKGHHVGKWALLNDAKIVELSTSRSFGRKAPRASQLQGRVCREVFPQAHPLHLAHENAAYGLASVSWRKSRATAIFLTVKLSLSAPKRKGHQRPISGLLRACALICQEIARSFRTPTRLIPRPAADADCEQDRYRT